MEKTLTLRIIAPNVTLTPPPPENADMVVLHCVTGELGILPSRLPCNMVLGKGYLRVHKGETEHRMKIDGGIASVSNDIVTVLSDSIEWA